MNKQTVAFSIHMDGPSTLKFVDITVGAFFSWGTESVLAIKITDHEYIIVGDDIIYKSERILTPGSVTVYSHISIKVTR